MHRIKLVGSIPPPTSPHSVQSHTSGDEDSSPPVNYMHIPFLISYLFILLFAQLSWCSRRNVTIDDEYGDPETGSMPTYLPSSNGSVWRLGDTCPGCHLTKVIDPSQAYLNTWHDCTWAANDEPYRVEIDFTGKYSAYIQIKKY